jgi:Asp-tRNA(Asn)/Glu-tRNA(Gln) amidotransferase A subunit family amidase
MVRRLREAGAIVVGKVNMPELATLDLTGGRMSREETV